MELVARVRRRGRGPDRGRDRVLGLRGSERVVPEEPGEDPRDEGKDRADRKEPLEAGALFPIEVIPVAFRPISDILPLTYVAPALQDILLRGWGVAGVATDLLALAISATRMLTGAIVLVRRQA